MTNPLTHKWGHPTPPAFLGYELLEASVFGALVGAFGAKLFKQYTVQSGAVMGLITRMASVIPNRISSNWGSIAKEDTLGPCTSCFARQVVWLTPLVAKIFLGSNITCKTIVHYWKTTAATTLVLYPIKHCVIYKALNLMGIGRMTIERGVFELVTRPKVPLGQRAQISDAQIHLAPSLPEFKEVEELTDVPTLLAMANNHLEEGQILHILEKEPEAPSVGASAVEKEFYKITRNVAFHVHRISDSKQKARVLCKINAGFSQCETRQLTVFYDILAALNAHADGPLEDLQLKIRLITHEIKREIFQDFAMSQGIESQNVHSLAALTRNCGTELGLVQGELDPERAFIERTGAPKFLGAFLGLLINNPALKRENKHYWIQAVKTRYRAYDVETLIGRARQAINKDHCCVAMQALAKHLQAKEAKTADGDNADVMDLIEEDGLVTQYYCTPRERELGYELNDEGIILLLKLTGDLVNDERLHTELSNEEVLDPKTC